MGTMSAQIDTCPIWGMIKYQMITTYQTAAGLSVAAIKVPRILGRYKLFHVFCPRKWRFEDLYKKLADTPSFPCLQSMISLSQQMPSLVEVFNYKRHRLRSSVCRKVHHICTKPKTASIYGSFRLCLNL